MLNIGVDLLRLQPRDEIEQSRRPMFSAPGRSGKVLNEQYHPITSNDEIRLFIIIKIGPYCRSYHTRPLQSGADLCCNICKNSFVVLQ